MNSYRLRVEGLSEPSETPMAEDITEADRRLYNIREALKTSGDIDFQEDRMISRKTMSAISNNEYDLQYNYLRYIGLHSVHSITAAVLLCRVDGVKNTGAMPLEEQIEVIDLLQGDDHKWNEPREVDDNALGVYEIALRRSEDVTEIIEILKRGIVDPEEVESLLDDMGAHPKSLLDGVL